MMSSVDTVPFFEARAERFAYLACATLILYEYFLQLGAEVEFFWKQRWSVAKVLFLWSRYYGLAFNMYVRLRLPWHEVIEIFSGISVNAFFYVHPRPWYKRIMSPRPNYMTPTQFVL
ncbi:hypothetical protein Moror_1890 [Moniliophthora roreri MCA 2997]|uniref:DUF6533 domain-containing protein n=1 Tax=Moniliophthora roreri (strain MCA 2997) TaxID=1381753 RepID=V2WLG4_MONRO|nr:hypothetical protein Moror_1890 [Moniliophthora roreri MCA 2997]